MKTPTTPFLNETMKNFQHEPSIFFLHFIYIDYCVRDTLMRFTKDLLENHIFQMILVVSMATIRVDPNNL